MLLSRFSDAVDAFLRFTAEGCRLAIGAVVLVVALNAVGRQARTQTPTGTLGSVALIICRGDRGCSRNHRAGDDWSMLGISGIKRLLGNVRRAQVSVNTLQKQVYE